jgi:hypothetical protein
MGTFFAFITTPRKSCVWGRAHPAATESARARKNPINRKDRDPNGRKIMVN